MAQDAIQPDASEVVEEVVEQPVEQPAAEPAAEVVEPVEEEVVEQPVLERDNLMADLAKRRREQNEGTASEDPEESPVSEEVVDPDAAPAAEPVQPVQPAQDELVALKVNGQDVFKTQQEVDDAGGVAAIQKQLSGEMKLQLAAQKNQQLAQRQLELDERERNLIARETQQVAPPAVAQPAAPTIDVNELAEKLVVGDTSKVAEALGTIVNATQQPVAQPAAPVQQVSTDEVVAQIENNIARKNAVTQFSTEFADVFNNPNAKAYANEQTKLLQSTNPDWTPSQILTEAGNRARAVHNTRPAVSAAAPTSLEQKAQRKQETVDRVPQAQARGATQTQQNKPKTRAEIFAEIEAKRSH